MADEKASEFKDSRETQAASEVPVARAGLAPSMSVWARIKDHKIAQWTLAYVAAAYALLDGTKILSEAFDWPHWLLRAVAALLVLGLPLMVTLAWYHGHRALRRVGRAELTIITVLLVIAGVVLWRFARAPEAASTSKAAAAAQPAAGPTQAVAAKGSIAVLPFVDMSEKHDQEYFSDGLSEELIDHLAHYPDLKVIARTSSFAFKGKNEDMRSIALKLGVANLLEGSVRKSGDELRITAQLIRALDGVHLWSEIYDRKLTDIFKIQDEISTTVAKELNVALHADNSGSVQSVPRNATNVDAYNLVLQGNYFYWRGSPGDTARAIELFKQATDLDFRYAAAWAQLARAYAWQGITGERRVANAEVRIREAAERALALDPNSAVAYYARGNFQSLVTGDWMAAQSDLERAVALDPLGEVGAYAQGAIVRIKANVSGRIRDEIDWYRRLLERNPLDTTILFQLVRTLQAAGQLDESAATSRKLLQLNPAFAGAQSQYALTLLLMGKDTEALAEALHEPDDASRLQALACIYWAMGRRTESDSALRDLERGFSDRNVFQIAAVHAYRGGKDSAFTWLQQTYVQRRGSLIDLKVSPLFRNLRSDPRFYALLRKAKLVE
jgi:adenylate cyclase